MKFNDNTLKYNLKFYLQGLEEAEADSATIQLLKNILDERISEDSIKKEISDLEKAILISEKPPSEAQYLLGCCYLEGLGVVKETKRAVEFFLAATKNNNVEARGSLGQCYLNASGVGSDVRQAIILFNQEPRSAQTEYLLGELPPNV